MCWTRLLLRAIAVSFIFAIRPAVVCFSLCWNCDGNSNGSVEECEVYVSGKNSPSEEDSVVFFGKLLRFELECSTSLMLLVCLLDSVCAPRKDKKTYGHTYCTWTCVCVRSL